MCGRPLEPAKRRKELSSVNMSLLKACSEILAYSKERSAIPGPYSSFAEKEKTFHLHGLLIGNSLRGISAGEDYYAADIVFSLAPSSTDRSIGFEIGCYLAQMVLQYMDIVIKVLVVHREVPWVELNLTKLHSGTEGFYCVIPQASVFHCTSGMHALKFYLLDYLVRCLEMFGHLKFINVTLF